jgi:hypothetical protein
MFVHCFMTGGMTVSKCSWSLVAVHWIDAFDSSNGWISTKDYKPKTQHVVSVGWLCPDLLEGYVSVTCSWCPMEEPEMDTIGMVTHIPVGMVQKVVVLDEPDWVVE